MAQEVRPDQELRLTNMTPKQKSKARAERLDALQEAILQQIEARVGDKDNPLSAAELGALLTKVADVRTNEVWSRKLERAILRNPSLLVHPTAAGGASTQKLRTLLAKWAKAEKGDGRESGTKLKQGIRDRHVPVDPETGQPIELPADD